MIFPDQFIEIHGRDDSWPNDVNVYIYNCIFTSNIVEIIPPSVEWYERMVDQK